MSERIALKPGTAICESNGVTITVGNLIGVGGSALVYEGKKITSDKPDGEFKLIKEVYPNFEARYPDTIKRCEDGKIVCDSKESLSLFETIKQFARNEVNNSRELAADVTGRRNDFFFNKHELVEDVWSEDTLCSVNGNMYILIDTTQGKTLEKIIKEYRFGAKNEYSIHSLYDVVVYVIGIVNALKQFHNHNPQYLHLDVSPDNIYVSNSKLVRLIDFNSASCKDSDGVFVSLSQKVGYSAPEICFDEKNPCVQSDLFSVTAVLFNMVFGALYDVRISEIKTNDGLRQFISDYYDKYRKNALLRDISPRATYILQDILVKGLNWKPENRYENCDEMLQSLEQLRDEAHPRKVYLIDTRANITLPEHCLPRDKMINKIRERLLSNNHVFVSGEGGSGKSAIAAMYIKRFDKEYETICFCEFSSDFRTMILDMPFNGINVESSNGISYGLNNKITLQQVYDIKYAQLKKANNKTLLVIENYNIDDSNYKQKNEEANFLRDLHCHIIFNTRKSIDSSDFLYVDDVSDDEAYEFFTNASEIEDIDENGVRRLIEYSDKNFLVMNLLARLLKTSRTHDPLRILELLNSNEALTPRVRTEVYRNGISVIINDRVENHLLRVFNVSELDESLLEILSAMTLVPYSGMEKSNFEDALRLDEWDDRVSELITLGWIICNGEFIYLHKAISDLLYRNEQTKPDFDKLDDFISKSCVISHIIEREALSEKRNIMYKVADFYATKIKGVGIGCVNVYDEIGFSFIDRKDFDNALEYCIKALDIRERVIGKKHKGTAVSYNNVAACYSGKKDYDRALEYLDKAKNIYYEVDDQLELCSIYNAMGICYSANCDYDNMVRCNDKVIEIVKRYYGDNHEETANIYYNIGMHYFEIGNYDDAKKYLDISVEILELIHSNETTVNIEQNLAICYKNIGAFYVQIRNYDKGMKFLKKALGLNISIYGANYIETADCYSHIAYGCCHMGNYYDAMENFKRAYEINNEIHSEIYRGSISAYYEDLGWCYSEKGDYDTALVYLDKALKAAENNNYSSYDIARLYNNIGSCCESKGDYDGALLNFKKSEELCEDAEDFLDLKMVCNKILLIYKDMGLSKHAKIYESKLKKIDRNHPELSKKIGKINVDKFRKT